MGIHGMSNSFNRRNMYASKQRVRLNAQKQRKLKRRNQRESHMDPYDLQLAMPIMKKRRSNPLNNFSLSGKKRRKLVKAARMNEREKIRKEKEQEELRKLLEAARAEKRAKRESRKRAKDVVMNEAEEPKCDVTGSNDEATMEIEDDSESHE